MARPSLGKSGRTVSASTKITQKEQEALIAKHGSLYKAVRRGVELALGEATATTLDGRTVHGLEGFEAEEPAPGKLRGHTMRGVVVDEAEAFRKKAEGNWVNEAEASLEPESTEYDFSGNTITNESETTDDEQRRQEARDRLKQLSEPKEDPMPEDNEALTGVVQPPEEDEAPPADHEPEQPAEVPEEDWEEDFAGNSPTTQGIQKPDFTPPPHVHVKDHVKRKVMVKGSMKKIWACSCGEVMS